MSKLIDAFIELSKFYDHPSLTFDLKSNPPTVIFKGMTSGSVVEIYKHSQSCHLGCDEDVHLEVIRLKINEFLNLKWWKVATDQGPVRIHASDASTALDEIEKLGRLIPHSTGSVYPRLFKVKNIYHKEADSVISELKAGQLTEVPAAYSCGGYTRPT